MGTGGVYAYSIAVDGDSAYLGDSLNSPLVAKLNLRDGSVSAVSTGRNVKTITVDPLTRIAYVSTPDAKTVWEITPDGHVEAHPVPTVPLAMIATPDGLLVAGSSGLFRLELSSWSATGRNSWSSSIGSLLLDDGRGTLYATTDQDVFMLDVDTLTVRASHRPASGASHIDVDASNGAVLLSGLSAVEMYSATPTVARVSGLDRYDVSAAVSKRQFAPMVPVVYVASGEVFSDALSASAAAGAHGGAVLLVRKNEIPTLVAAELRRLTPQRIVLLGGFSTISASVEKELGTFSTDVSRIAGADRYEVSATVSQKAFGATRPIAYIAAGATFADALSGSAAAGKMGGPVLLVPKDSVPTAISDELRRLAPAKIVVLGGTASVSQAVFDEVALIQHNTSRIVGEDRYAVSAQVSAGTFPTPTTTVYVSSGLVYPDALSGSAAAIAAGSPVLLVRSDSIPTAIAAELDRLDPRRIVILGGTNSVSAAVEAKLRSFITV
jgi:putative cell wall-binding protein